MSDHKAEISNDSRWMESLKSEFGFSMAEFLIASLILLVVSTIALGVARDIQRITSYQAEVAAVMSNLRLAMETVEQYIRQSGNDPHHTGLTGLTLNSSSEIRVQSDITGSAAPSNPDKGDPDGDTVDSGEDIIVRHNASSRTLEIIPSGGNAQAVANFIEGFQIEGYDSNGLLTPEGSQVCRVAVTLTAATTLRDPQTGEVFGLQLTRSVQPGNRQ
jgi:Tfp pilus assembly protein PilW